MKFIPFIVFLFVSSIGFGQDSLKLVFPNDAATINKEHVNSLDQHIGNRIVEDVLINTYISPKGKVSSNRILMERRLLAVKEHLFSKGVPFNVLRTRFILGKNESIENSIFLKTRFLKETNDKVLKKTPVVQIAEVDYTIKKSAPAIVEEKKEVKPDPKIEVEKNEILSVTEFKKDELISLPNLLFEPGTHFLLPGSEKVLKELLNVMLAKPKLRIELQGHICCRLGGLDGFDPTTGKENLSQMRAKVVYLFLVSRGVDKYRMTYKGFGSSRKLYPDLNSRSAQTLNRRVEVLVTATE